MKEQKIKKMFLSLLFFSLFFLIAGHQNVSASPDYSNDIDCISEELSRYIAQVFQNLNIAPSQNRLDHIVFLSPAFNMTASYFPSFIEKFNAALNNQGYDLNNFYAIAGNAYNTSWGSISDFVDTARKTAIGDKNIILTEIGWYPHETNNRAAAINQLKNEISKFDSENVIGGLIFDVFGNNPHFIAQSMADQEINDACSGDCYSANVGANSASYYSSDESFYQRAKNNNMKYTLEIAQNNINGVMKGINSAHSKGITPIIRIGVGDNSGGFDQPEMLASFIQELNNRVSQDVYIIVGPNEPLAESWATPDCQYLESDVLTLAGASNVCSTFDIKRETNLGIFEGIEGTEEKYDGQIEDKLSTKNNTLPDFAQAQKITKKALAALLPQSLLNTLSLPSSGTIYLTHFALQEKSKRRGEVNPKEKITLSPEWPQLAGATRGLYSVFTPFSKDPQAGVSHFRFQLEDTGFLEDGDPFSYSCQPGMSTKDKELPEPNHVEKKLILKNIFVTVIKTFSDWIDQTLGRMFVERKEKKEFKILSLGKLPAGEKTTNEAVSLAQENLPSDVIAQMENPHDGAKALKATFNYEIDQGGGGAKPASYFGLNKWRANYCLGILCPSLPSDKNVSSLDPLCPSCNPDDYKRPSQPIPAPSPGELPYLCQWDGWGGGCDYYDPQGHASCAGDPVCEGGRCNPLEYGLAKDYLNNGCSLPYPTNNCTDRSVCVEKSFARNPSGGYGPCHYKNANVCVRADSDQCAAVCNWACCKYQK